MIKDLQNHFITFRGEKIINNDIDFVIPQVNGSDPAWIEKRNKYSSNDNFNNIFANGSNRYRDYGTLKYLLRSIEKYASWVHKVFILTDNQKPQWFKESSKVVIIDHKDFIDGKYLPTFNSNAIELNIGKIKKLSEYFVLFNDDCLLNNYVEKEDFFKDGVPVDAAIFSPIFPESDFDRIRINNVIIINKYFKKRQVQRKKFFKIFSFKYGTKILNNILMAPYSRFSGFYDFHLPIAYTKSEFLEVTKFEKSKIDETISHKFREDSDLSHWLIRYWRLMSGDFETQKLPFGKLFYLFQTDEWEKEILKGKLKSLCINDGENIMDIASYQERLIRVLDRKFPTKGMNEE